MCSCGRTNHLGKGQRVGMLAASASPVAYNTEAYNGPHSGGGQPQTSSKASVGQPDEPGHSALLPPGAEPMLCCCTSSGSERKIHTMRSTPFRWRRTWGRGRRGEV